VWTTAIRVALLAAMLLFARYPAEAAAETTAPYWLLALSKADHVLAVIDPATLKVVARVPVGPDQHEVVASTDGRFAYVSNTGYGALHEIDVIDLVALKALPAIDTAPFKGPHGLAYVGGKLWFTAQGSKCVARYDPTVARVDWTMGTGQDTTHMIHVSADTERIYTTNVGSGTVSILEYLLVQPELPPTGVMPAGLKPQMDWVQTLLPVGKGAEGFDVSPDSRELWTATPQGALSIIDLTNKTIAATIDTNVLGLHRVNFTPDGRSVLLASVATGDLLIYDVASRREIKRLKICRGAGLMVDAAGQRAFVSCTPDNVISVIDLKTLEETARLDIGGRPDGMAIAKAVKH
jgi:DNA-binding beta-propeller fold protein YncE